jgi:ABC-type Fe3+ transport system permease subunit
MMNTTEIPIASSHSVDSADEEDIHSVVSSVPTASKEFNQASNQGNEHQLAGKETKNIAYLRFVVAGFLVLIAVSVSVGVYLFTRNDQEQDFETQFEAQAMRMLERFHEAVESKLDAMDALATSITSFALSTGATFPNVTIRK